MKTLDFTEYFSSLCKDLPFFSVADDKSRLLLSLFAYYDYFLASEDNEEELEKGLLNVPETGSHIGGIFCGDFETGASLDFLVSDYKEVPFSTTEHLRSVLQKNSQTILSSLNRLSSADPAILKRIKQIKDDSSEKISHYRLILLTNEVPDSNEKEAILEMLDSFNQQLPSEMSACIFFGDDVSSFVQDVEHPKLFVHKGQLLLENPGALAYHGKDFSLLTTITAKSLKKVYEDFHNDGLFAMNLRYFVKLDRVDTPIKDTIQNHGDDFWYLNNGIIILCDDYSIKGDVLSLTNFSIVNGAQTTTLIGTTPFAKDFYVVAKIIKNDKIGDQKVAFATQVAEASNSQKQIKIKDIISNRPEQRDLKNRLSQVGIFTLIKRGDIPTEKIDEPWKKTSNNEIAQLVYSFVYSRPGIARSSISKLLSDEDAYGLIFKYPLCNDLLIDLLHLRSIFKKWKRSISTDEATDSTKNGLLKNGMFTMLGLFGVACKLCFNDLLVNDFYHLGNDMNSSACEFYLGQPDLNHRIFRSFQDETVFFRAFDFLYESFMLPAFSKKQSLLRGDYSSFTKNQNYFMSFCIPVFLDQITASHGVCPDSVKENILPLLAAFSDEEKRGWNAGFNDNYDPHFAADLNAIVCKMSREALTPAYCVLTVPERNLIMKKRPDSIDDLVTRVGIDEERAKKYGSKIIDIVRANGARV